MNRSGSWLDLNEGEDPGDVVLPVETRVKNGMALLDEKHGPEWVHKIDVDTLDVKGSCSCVLGQVYGGYGFGTRALLGAGWRAAEAVDGGFFAHDHHDDRAWTNLTTAWRLAILARRAEATL